MTLLAATHNTVALCAAIPFCPTAEGPLSKLTRFRDVCDVSHSSLNQRQGLYEHNRAMQGNVRGAELKRSEVNTKCRAEFQHSGFGFLNPTQRGGLFMGGSVEGSAGPFFDIPKIPRTMTDVKQTVKPERTFVEYPNNVMQI
jgi:hypothetical protein